MQESPRERLNAQPTLLFCVSYSGFRIIWSRACRTARELILTYITRHNPEHLLGNTFQGMSHNRRLTDESVSSLCSKNGEASSGCTGLASYSVSRAIEQRRLRWCSCSPTNCLDSGVQ